MRLVRYVYPDYRTYAPAPGGFNRSPWSGFEGEIDRLFETARRSFPGAGAAPTQIPVDLYEDQANTYVRAELPGVNRDDINVEVSDGRLNIRAVRKTPATPAADAPDSTAAEKTFSFSRTVNLSAEVQTDRIGAAFENGVLTVTLPKREEAKPKKITVAVK